MRFFGRSRAQLSFVIAAAVPLGCSSPQADESTSIVQDDLRADREALERIPTVTHRDLCGPARPGTMRCHAKIVTHANGEAVAAAAPAGLGASDIQAAYKLPTRGGDGRTVAVVDAYDAPNAEKNLGVYRAQFGLPPCTTANGCFKKVNQDGQPGPLPDGDPGWAGEIALDIAMVSAACPDCNILLVEARSSDATDLGIAVGSAARLGASAITNSYGGPEDDPLSIMSAPFYNQPGVLLTASSGDDGYGTTESDDGALVPEVAFPSSSEFVMAVGGTSLTKSTSARGWAERAWRGAGSGCSSLIAKPSWQTDTGCSKRMVVDVAAVADPATGVAYYDGAWRTVGGTSAASPIVAATFTLFNLTSDVSWPYTNASRFFDVISGSNGNCASTYECIARAGYDGPTGIGTPNGAAFPAPSSGNGGATTGDTAGGTGGASVSAGTGGTGTHPAESATSDVTGGCACRLGGRPRGAQGLRALALVVLGAAFRKLRRSPRETRRCDDRQGRR